MASEPSRAGGVVQKAATLPPSRLSPGHHHNNIRFKCILLGEAGVGKTSLATRIAKGTFQSHAKPTYSPDSVQTKILLSCGAMATVDLWDTAGQERFHSLSYSYFRGTHGALLLYDSSSKIRIAEQLEDAKYNLSDDKDRSSSQFHEVLLFLVATKMDDDKMSVFTEDQIRSLSVSHGIPIRGHFSLSSKTGENVDSCIRTVAEELWKSSRERTKLTLERQTIHLPDIKSDVNKPRVCNC